MHVAIEKAIGIVVALHGLLCFFLCQHYFLNSWRGYACKCILQNLASSVGNNSIHECIVEVFLTFLCSTGRHKVKIYVQLKILKLCVKLKYQPVIPLASVCSVSVDINAISSNRAAVFLLCLPA